MLEGHGQQCPARSGPLAATVLAFVELAVDSRAHIVAPVVELFLERVLDDLSLLFHHQDLAESGGEFARAQGLEWPHAADFIDAHAYPPAGVFIQAQVVQRLAHVEV